MPRPFPDYSSQFFWNFKTMDNANYNFEILELLYKAKRASGDDAHFNKPIIILIMSVIECTLYDFIVRIHQHRRDIIPDITQDEITYFRDFPTTDELRILIPKIQDKNLFRVGVEDTLYADLDHLRKIRNRVHIQNRYNALPPDEEHLFTNTELSKAQKCLEKVYDALCNVYPRWQNEPISMIDFPRPWLQEGSGI